MEVLLLSGWVEPKAVCSEGGVDKPQCMAGLHVTSSGCTQTGSVSACSPGAQIRQTGNSPACRRRSGSAEAHIWIPKDRLNFLSANKNT